MKMKPDTQYLHTGNEVDPLYGASSVPIYQASTFHQGFDDEVLYDYARSGNPTRAALENIVATLEGGVRGFAFSSGMAAITAALLILPSGSHVIACEDLYGGTFRALTRVFTRLGIETTFVDATDPQNIARALRPNTKAVYLETPSNPTMRIIDIRACAEIAKGAGAVTMVDNTFMTPYFQKPHELGADIVLHSATKFLGGHSDVIAGVATVNSDALAQEMYLIQNGFGAVLGPQDCFLVMRGIKTLGVRMRQSEATAIRLAAFLREEPQVQRIYYPGIKEHEGHATHMRQATGPGALLSFTLRDEDAVRAFVKRLKLPLFAVSLGAVESILSYPIRMSHAAMPEEERQKRGITAGLLRMSVGLEDIEDLIEDFRQAFAAL
ncbi:cystathionine gamma-synthase [Ferroacidibacillus organovorans]|uniref:cysteine-S-conjugate beta-lyase n=4 Tax=Ferroacidibacillus organovorans TaxID=1765683 RepID=A0A1V4ESD8_9BACL|nr:cystathionine gamma-synthase [Ferroacidibacillus organovorans]OPG15849.1 cystathionine gamma-synthase [Ferroacidibacillus organovorans]